MTRPFLSNYRSTSIEFCNEWMWWNFSKQDMMLFAAILSFSVLIEVFHTYTLLYYLCIDTVLGGSVLFLSFFFSSAQIYVNNLLALEKKARHEHYSEKQGHYLRTSACFIFCPPNIDALKSISTFFESPIRCNNKRLSWYIMEEFCILHMLHITSAISYTSFSCRPSLTLKHGRKVLKGLEVGWKVLYQ